MIKIETIPAASLRDRDEWICTLTYTSKDFEKLYQNHGPYCKIMKVVGPNKTHYYARGRKADRIAAQWFFIGCVEGLVK